MRARQTFNQSETPRTVTAIRQITPQHYGPLSEPVSIRGFLKILELKAKSPIQPLASASPSPRKLNTCSLAGNFAGDVFRRMPSVTPSGGLRGQDAGSGDISLYQEKERIRRNV
jgi:hypothetical protein